MATKRPPTCATATVPLRGLVAMRMSETLPLTSADRSMSIVERPPSGVAATLRVGESCATGAVGSATASV